MAKKRLTEWCMSVHIIERDVITKNCLPKREFALSHIIPQLSISQFCIALGWIAERLYEAAGKKKCA